MDGAAERESRKSADGIDAGKGEIPRVGRSD